MLDASAPNSDTGSELGEVHASAGFFALVRELAHDFNNIWSSIFGWTQQIYEIPGFQDRGELLEKIESSSTNGLFYSRNVMDVLLANPSKAETLDVCDWVRVWICRTGEILGHNINLSCMVPSQPLHIRFNTASLNVLLLSLVGYALKSDANRWVMVGVRDVAALAHTPGSVDLIFLCRQSDHRTYLQGLQRKVSAATAMVAPYGGTVFTSVVAPIGINVRIRFPLASAPAAAQPEANLQMESM